jgi:glutamyl-tRNA synthetase
MGWSMPDGREIFSFQDVVESFSWDRFSPVGPVFDVTKLDWLNGQYLQALSDDDLLRRARPFLPGPDEEAALEVLAPTFKTRLKRLSEIGEWVDYLYVGSVDLDRELLLKQGLADEPARQALLAAREIVRDVDVYAPERLETVFNDVRAQHDWKARSFFMTLRVALTGKTVSPPLFAVMAALGRERAEARLTDAERLLEPTRA